MGPAHGAPVRAESRAPAKVILAGEHFVVHGGKALAVSIDLWARATAESGREITLESDNPPGSCGSGGCAPHLRPLRAMLEELVADHPGAVGAYRLSSEIPEGRGLGSSAAAAVALAAAALALAEGTALREEVYEYAMISERLMHGNPSGVDPAVSAHGGAMLYSRSEGVRRIQVGEGLLALCCGPSPRSTAAMVELVAGFKRSRPGLFDALLRSSSDLAEVGASALAEGNLLALASVIRWHQGALRILGVSSEELEAYVASMESAGMAAKLTGAGGGGCALGLPLGRAAEPKCSAPVVRWARYPLEGVTAWRLR